jgi:toxin ParE1/3/4
MSARKRRIVLAPRASDDLDDILLYTELHWGKRKRQRDTYRKALFNGFRRLADYPGLGREQPNYEPGARSFLVRQHVVIYRATETELRISRILHTRRDIDAETTE